MDKMMKNKTDIVCILWLKGITVGETLRLPQHIIIVIMQTYVRDLQFFPHVNILLSLSS